MSASQWRIQNPFKHLRLSVLIFAKHSILYVWQVSEYASKSLISAVPQPAFTSSKLTIETLEQGVKYVQS